MGQDISFIDQSIRDAWAQLHTGYHSSNTTAAATTPVTAPTTNTACTLSQLLTIRHRFQHSRDQLAPISTGIRRFFHGRSGAS
jgi:hypothetical protein